VGTLLVVTAKSTHAGIRGSYGQGGHALVVAPSALGLSSPMLLVAAGSVHTTLLVALAPEVGDTHVVRPGALLVAGSALVVGFDTLRVASGTSKARGCLDGGLGYLPKKGYLKI
jgi:hypothetical protein